ncbi:hypothetical protein BDV35DRAFT_352576 [Aspergillus flavus]|uniref:Uncharacterized protein n=1 Tax=Aspergillus flavus TaxID=5059 RepID=A0A5N6GZM5_ASPFL|nr:hypothetical protein BDV35DRAFT_352576 [Aspergillus flavus]
MDKLSKATYPLLDRIFNKRDSSRRLYGLGCEKHKPRKRCRKCSNLPSYSQPDAAYHLCPEQCDGFYSINDSNNDCQLCGLLAKIIRHYHGDSSIHMQFRIEARNGYPLIITGLNYTDGPKRIEVFKDIGSFLSSSSPVH